MKRNEDLAVVVAMPKPEEITDYLLKLFENIASTYKKTKVQKITPDTSCRDLLPKKADHVAFWYGVPIQENFALEDFFSTYDLVDLQFSQIKNLFLKKILMEKYSREKMLDGSFTVETLGRMIYDLIKIKKGIQLTY